MATQAEITRRATSAVRSKAPAADKAAGAQNGAHANGAAAGGDLAPGKERSWADSDGTGDRQGVWGLSGGLGEVVAVVGTVFIILATPTFTNLLAFLLFKCDGSLVTFYNYFDNARKLGGAVQVAKDLFAAMPTPFDPVAVKYVFSYFIIEAVLQIIVPGKEFRGPVTPKGNVPVYKANGVQRYLTSMALFFAGWKFGLINPADVIAHYGEILSTLTVFAIFFCVFLTFKGLYFPSSTDSGTTGSLLFDFYWGTELYPRIGSFDLKTWTNCSVSMMGWATVGLICALKQYDELGYVTNSMLVSVAILELYLLKFFMWETGYWSSLDIAHDRAGFYICWGVLAWVPSAYLSAQLYLVNHPIQWPWPVAMGILAVGLSSVYINYDADRQRQNFRRSNGKELVWGKPPKMIKATYVTGDGEEKTSLLLLSGWWGLARHFHYVPELLLAFCWSAPAGFNHFIPYFYFVFLCTLLTDRAFRDDIRCRAKYGKFWDEYCKAVPYKILPGIL